MKGGNRLLFLALILIISAAHSKRVFQTMQDNSGINGIKEGTEDIEKRGYYWLVSSWSPCKCHGNQQTGIQSRDVSCTKTPCHFIRAPRRHQACQCFKGREGE
ncbi:hypothetical protein ABFA07_008688 [Porites harrisoni]